jgi:hypothetical protein
MPIGERDEDMMMEIGVLLMVMIMATKTSLRHGQRNQSDP